MFETPSPDSDQDEKFRSGVTNFSSEIGRSKKRSNLSTDGNFYKVELGIIDRVLCLLGEFDPSEHRVSIEQNLKELKSRLL